MSKGGATTKGTKAVPEMAKLGGNRADAVAGIRDYLAQTLGTIPEDLLGVAGDDWVHQHRRRNLATLHAKTAALLGCSGAGTVTEPSASIMVPLLQAAADEGREELQDLWAALLARAFQDGGRHLRRSFIAALQRMEPADAIILKLYGEWWDIPGVGQGPHPWAAAQALGMAESEFNLSVSALQAVGCVSEPTSERESHLTPFGMELLKVCSPPRVA